MDPWYKISNENTIETPSLLLYSDRIKENIQKMVTISGNPERLWPHVKSHKIAEIVHFLWSNWMKHFFALSSQEPVPIAPKITDRSAMT